jgi:16S rRNA (uracil1498-N3)-methyltransferase
MEGLDRSALRSTSAHVLVDVDSLGAAGTVSIDDDTHHHLRKVLRLRDGDTVGVTDGAGRWCLATVVVAGTELRLEPVSPLVVEPARSTPITIAAAIPKGERLDWMVQKVTELGVDRLALLDADRSVVRWKPDRREHQLARLQRIADEALRQSRRVFRLRIDAPVAAVDVLDGFVAAEPGGRALAAGDVAVAIGPEGGWSDAELAVARDRVDLGPTILRTETAAVAASTLCVTFER